jgi:hypothetical protein
MFRSRSENLRSIYVLLFANFAMFLLQYQDPERYARLFCFDRDSIVYATNSGGSSPSSSPRAGACWSSRRW